MQSPPTPPLLVGGRTVLAIFDGLGAARILDPD
jgi:hypothetical protein